MFFENAKDSEIFLNTNGNSNGVLFLPAFNGLGAPFWDSDIRGGFSGITQDTTIHDIVTSAFQSITFQTREITKILEKNEIHINKLLVDGGMVSNGRFCQALADTLQKSIVKPKNIESTALGACKVAMIASGEKMSNIVDNLFIYEPNKSLKNIYESNYVSWRDYVDNNLS